MSTSSKINPVMKDFLSALLMPTLIGKGLIYFFGLKFSEYPGEGWGYGLAEIGRASVGNLLRFLKKYRHIQDP